MTDVEVTVSNVVQMLCTMMYFLQQQVELVVLKLLESTFVFL